MAMMFLDTLCGHTDTDGRGMIVTLCADRHRDGFVCCPRGRISADARRQLPKSQVIICPCRARGGMAHALGLEMPDGREKGEKKPAQFLTGTEGFVLLRDGKEHFFLSCSVLPSEISFPAGGEGHWAGRGGSPLKPHGMCCLCRAHPALGRWQLGHRDRTPQSRVEPPSSSPALKVSRRVELPGDTQGDTCQLSHCSSVPERESAQSAQPKGA